MSAPEPEVEFTTAQALGSYLRELVDEGVPQVLAESLVMDAARQIHNESGLCLGRKESTR